MSITFKKIMYVETNYKIGNYPETVANFFFWNILLESLDA